jgi:N-acetylmuramoyl-L-alanine amidase
MILQGKAKYPVTEVILHCAAIKRGQFDRMSAFQVFETVHRWHRERGWRNGFGYHGLIMPSGEFYRGRPYEMIGAHCIERNRGSLGFLLIESEEITKENAPGAFEDFYTPSQDYRLRAVLRSLPGIRKVSGHNEYASKLCPGFSVPDWL